MTANAQHLALLAELGIPENYGSDPLLPVYAEAVKLVEAGPNIVGRMQTLTPATTTAWQGMQAAALAEQIDLVMVSGFRSLEYQAGLIRKMTLAGRSVYEHQYGYPRHDHLHCEVCNALIEFHSPQLDKLVHEVATRHDFEINGHRMFVTGVCEKCRRRGEG